MLTSASKNLDYYVHLCSDHFNPKYSLICNWNLEQVTSIATNMSWSKSYNMELNKHLIDLPDEILIWIMTFLSKRDLLTAAIVCKKLNTLARDSTLWKKLELIPKSSLRSMENFMSLIGKFSLVDTLKVTLKRDGDNELNFTPIEENEQLRQAVANLLIQKPSVKNIELDFHYLGLKLPSTDCHPLYNTFEEHGFGIQNVKISEVGEHSYIRWYHWTEEFLVVAPRFWSHVKVLKLNDVCLPLSFPADNGALSKIIKNSGHLEELFINSRSILRLNDVQNFLTDMEDTKLQIFDYMSDWDIRHPSDSESEWCNLKSKSYHIRIEGNEEKRKHYMSIGRIVATRM